MVKCNEKMMKKEEFFYLPWATVGRNLSCEMLLAEKRTVNCHLFENSIK
jgi:hypothetical protein